MLPKNTLDIAGIVAKNVRRIGESKWLAASAASNLTTTVSASSF
jgi:hypothetical protein